MFWVSVPNLVAFYEISLGLAFAVATVQCGTILLAFVVPKTAVVLQLVALVVMGLGTAANVGRPWPLPISGLVALSLFLGVIAFRERWPLSIVVWWLSFSTLVLVVVTNPTQFPLTDSWGYSLLIDVTVTLIVLVASIGLGQRGRIRAQLTAAQRDVDLEQAKRRYVEERGRIARELHDVVAHSMSIVHIQAVSARYRIDDLSPQTIAEFDEIGRSARRALGEMRQLLGALRMEDDTAEHAPQPGIQQLGSIAESAAKVGTSATIDLASDAEAWSPLVQLTVYRIVQEAVSNVVRHAPLAAVSIRVIRGEGEVEVSVENDATAVGGSAMPASDSGGHGLRGMRERLTLLGGTLSHHPTDAGGFRVEARLPLDNEGEGS